MASVSIVLNGKKIKAPRGSTILETARDHGIRIPTLCHDTRLEPYGSCRVCLVRVEGRKNLVPSCSTEVADGMVIDTESEEVLEARHTSLALLVSDHVGDCVSPCSLECPANIDIQGYIALIRSGRYREAVALIKEKNPMPLTIGRVCPHPCESVCRRNRVDEPIAINNLKRFAADRDYESGDPWMPEKKTPTGLRAAVIGSGPAGLAAAYYLAVMGHEVTIFEANPEAGGMLRYGIPEYRLPKKVLDREIALILRLGIEIKYNVFFGRDITLNGLLESGYGAVFLGIGAQLSMGMRVKGENEEGVLSGIDFLRDVALGKKPPFRGKRVLVVGGGNTAMDASRTSIRLGAGEVVVLYRRTRKEMPANDVEIEEAGEENVQFRFLTAPVRVERGKNGLSVECIRMELGEPDGSGRRRPVPIENSNFTLEADYLITAIGQRTDTGPLADLDITTKRDTVQADPQTGATGNTAVFSGGDCVTGASTAISAIAGGRKAAYAMDRYLREGTLIEPADPEFNITRGELDRIPDEYFSIYEKAPRVSMPALDPETRISGFEEIEKGIREEAAFSEASRCLECGCIEGFGCKLREYATEFSVLESEYAGDKNEYPVHDDLLHHPPIIRDQNKCVKCGLCVRLCDEVWGLSVYGYVNRGFEMEIGPTLDRELSETACDLCGQCADACPTGALSLSASVPKPGPFKTEQREGACVLCSLGCSVRYNVYDNTVMSVSSYPGTGENDGCLCVRGRFGYGYLLPERRSPDALRFSDGASAHLPMEEAVKESASLLGKKGSTGIFTSTNLSNEEYELIRGLSGKLGDADIFHLSIDSAERDSSSLTVVNRSEEVRTRAEGLKTLSLDDIMSSSAIVLFTITPGRSFPILEMKIRYAAQAGVPLYIINETPARLDDYATRVFRVKPSFAEKFLRITAFLTSVKAGKKKPAVVKTNIPDYDVLFRAGTSPHALAGMINDLGGEPAFICDEDMIHPESLPPFIDLARAAGDGSRLLLMRRGSNPSGGTSSMKDGDVPLSITASFFAKYDKILLYKLEGIPAPEPDTVHIGFNPLDHYGRNGIFIPSSSLLETGGTLTRYDGKKISLHKIVQNDHNRDNIHTLSTLIGYL